jgi:hypothetical protein
MPAKSRVRFCLPPTRGEVLGVVLAGELRNLWPTDVPSSSRWPLPVRLLPTSPQGSSATKVSRATRAATRKPEPQARPKQAAQRTPGPPASTARTHAGERDCRLTTGLQNRVACKASRPHSAHVSSSAA